MPNEIELKLSLPITSQRQLLRQPILRQAVAKHTQQLINLYYDTPSFDLHRRCIALRLRKQGRIWLQTVKCAGCSAAGLSSRPEWETPYSGHFDFSAVDDPAVRDWLEKPKLLKSIAPLFETNFCRTTWRFEPKSGCVLLMTLDRGWIAAAGRREAISEVEIELGCPDEQDNVIELFKLAQTLGACLPLVPAMLSKAERGHRLFRGLPLAAQKARNVALAADNAPIQAFRQIALECLEHIQGNHDGSLQSDDPEFIHQMRVASRRLRAALRLFAPCLPAAFSETMLPPLRNLTSHLGQARDLDVLLMEIATPVVQALPGEPRLAALSGAITNRQYSARSNAMRYLESPDYGRLLLLFITQLHLPPFPGDDAAEPLSEFATARLKRLRKKMLVLAKASSIDDPFSLHRLRIGIKRLRYALEFFAPLAARRAQTRLLRLLSELQDELGQLNDLANAGTLLMQCAGSDPRLREAVSLVGGWHAARHRALLARIPAQIKKLVLLKLPRLS
jgi:adenylate cyclase